MEIVSVPPRRAHLVVLGAGPAGCLLALQAARAGWDVVLLDRKSFPRRKVCGGCLAPAAIRALHQAAAQQVLARASAAPLQRLWLRVPGGELRLPIPPAAAVDRQALDDQLLRLARAAGVLWCPETTGRVGSLTDKGRTVHWRSVSGESGHTLAQLVVVACGLHVQGAGIASPEFHIRPKEHSLVGAGLVQQIAAPEIVPPGQVLMAVGEEGYAGLVATARGQLNAAAAITPRALRHHGDLAAAVCRVFRRCGLELPQLAQLRWQGTPRLSHRVEPAARGRVFLVGDALEYVEPFTGQGIAAAYRQGLALWQAIQSAGGSWSPALERLWNARSKRLGRWQRFSTGLLVALLRRGPLVRRSVAVLNLCPAVAGALAHWVDQAFY